MLRFLEKCEARNREQKLEKQFRTEASSEHTTETGAQQDRKLDKRSEACNVENKHQRFREQSARIACSRLFNLAVVRDSLTLQSRPAMPLSE